MDRNVAESLKVEVTEISKGAAESLKIAAETSKGATENKNVPKIEVSTEKNEVLKKYAN